MEIWYALIFGSCATYGIGLIAVVIYVATRVEGGSDLFGSDAVKLAAVIVFALLGAIPTDVLTSLWLGVVRDHIEVAANLNLYVVAVPPAVAVVVAVQAIVLSRAYRPRPLLYGAIFYRRVRGRPRLLDVCVVQSGPGYSPLRGRHPHRRPAGPGSRGKIRLAPFRLNRRGRFRYRRPSTDRCAASHPCRCWRHGRSGANGFTRRNTTFPGSPPRPQRSSAPEAGLGSAGTVNSRGLAITGNCGRWPAAG